jgi:ankyrin repeat protein
MPSHDNARELDDAIARADLEAVARLLDAGVDPNVRDVLGDTPIMNAAWVGASAIVALLLERGADPNSAGLDGRNALQRLSTNHTYWYHGHDECVDLLLAAGARPIGDRS